MAELGACPAGATTLRSVETKDTMRRPIQIALIAVTVMLWIALAFLIVRQRHLLEVADPMSDTGISFGYAFLIHFAAPGLLGMTAIVACILAVMERGLGRHRKRGAHLTKK